MPEQQYHHFHQCLDAGALARRTCRITRPAQVGGGIDSSDSSSGNPAFEEGVVVTQPPAGGDYKVYQFSGAAWAPTGSIPDSSSVDDYASMHNGILAVPNTDTNMVTTYRVAEDGVHQVWRHVPVLPVVSVCPLPGRPALQGGFKLLHSL